MINRFEQFVSYISAIHRDIQRIERDEMEKLGLKGAYAQYLVAMHRHPEGITAVDLCEVCDKDKAAVSRAVTGSVPCSISPMHCLHRNISFMGHWGSAATQ